MDRRVINKIFGIIDFSSITFTRNKPEQKSNKLGVRNKNLKINEELS